MKTNKMETINNINYIVADRQTGVTLEECQSKEQAIAIVNRFEAADKKEGIYEPNFYAIKDIEANEWL